MWPLPLAFLTVLACTPTDVDSGGDTTPPGDTDTATETAETAETDTHTGDTQGDTAPPATDADQDGYDAEPWGDDCDDTDPDVNPGAAEIWYDGVDSDCSGGSDYDADLDGADAEEHGGTDCDDDDATIQEDCPSSDSLLDDYVLAAEQEQVDEISWNLSGITWNSATGTFMAVLDSARTLVELDEDMEVIRQISITNIDHSDTEDISYLGLDAGTPSYAVVTEQGVVYLGTVPDDGATSIDFADWQMITYNADDAGNSGGEGIAWDPATQTFWVCKEKNPMGVQTFVRPTTDADVSYEDGKLAVTDAFDADTLLAHYATDLSSCMFDERSGRLLLLSQESDIVLDVATDGTVFGTLDITETSLSKPEGLTLMDDGDMIIVGEPNQWVRYAIGEE